MSSRKPACDPCRQAKLACGHEQPVCLRCKTRDQIGACVYRNAPFKRTKPQRRGAAINGNANLAESTFFSSPSTYNGSPPTPQRTNYPNPGYLGASSHVDIFNHILSEQISEANPDASPVTVELISSASVSTAALLEDCPSAKQGAVLIKQLLSLADFDVLQSLVKFWRAKNVNLAVAGPFVDLCADTRNYTSLSSFQGPDWHLDLAATLLRNTTQPLEHDKTSILSSYSSQFLGFNTRWETLSIFLSAAIQATRDISFFPLLYTTTAQNRELRRLLTRLNDCALETCLSVDKLNDLQLVLQSENFIVHSYVDGDQSYRYWRTLGDTIASIFALGYHEDIDSKPGSPTFLNELRKTVFARTYSADKNVSIFLGRPLRMSKRFCHFQMPRCSVADEDFSEGEVDSGSNVWPPDATMSYAAETRWAAICTSVKEDIIELMFDRDRTNLAEKANALQTTADIQWNALPPHFQLENKVNLKQHTNIPFERDFLLSTRLNYLHISFLLQRLLLPRLSEPSAEIIDVAQQILHLIVEAILLRDELANSGTGLDWKIAYYGIPSAGILLLSILRQQRNPTYPAVPIPKAKIITDLTILAAEIDRGTVVRPEDANFALLSEATATIQRFLDGFYREREVGGAVQGGNQWLEQWDVELKDFDIDFWQGLGDFGTLFGVEGVYEGGGVS